MGLRGMRVRKSPLVRVLYAKATRPFPVNAKGAGPQTKHSIELASYPGSRTGCVGGY